MDRISVITICFNNLADLLISCASVDQQSHHPFEHIIINGSSTKEISDWLENEPQPVYRRWISERDKGISDAFNKGIQHANGEIIHLLNAGDSYYHASVLQTVLNKFSGDRHICWLSGRIEMKRGGIWVHVGVPFDPKLLYKGMRSISHPTYFVRAGVYVRVGLFHLDHQIAMDYDLLCRLKKEPYTYLPEVLIHFDDRGVSTTNYLHSLEENVRVYESHFGFSIACRLWQFRQRLLFYCMQSSFGKFLYKLKMGLSK